MLVHGTRMLQLISHDALAYEFMQLLPRHGNPGEYYIKQYSSGDGLCVACMVRQAYIRINIRRSITQCEYYPVCSVCSDIHERADAMPSLWAGLMPHLIEQGLLPSIAQHRNTMIECGRVNMARLAISNIISACIQRDYARVYCVSCINQYVMVYTSMKYQSHDLCQCCNCDMIVLLEHIHAVVITWSYADLPKDCIRVVIQMYVALVTILTHNNTQ